MATTVLSPPLQTSQQQQLKLSSPPADSNKYFSQLGSSHITSLPAYTDNNPRRASINRYSWSSASSSNSTPSPTSPNNGTAPTRKFRLPVRVSTDLTSFASSDSSPQSRRRSLSLASSDSKRRSSQIPALKKVEETNSKDITEKSAPKSPEKSPSKEQTSPPPPAYKQTTPVSDPKDTKTPPPTYQDAKTKETAPTAPAKAVEQPPPPVQKPAVAPSPAKQETTPATRSIPAIDPIKMSSAASSP